MPSRKSDTRTRSRSPSPRGVSQGLPWATRLNTLSPPRRPPSPCPSLRGLCEEAGGSSATSCTLALDLGPSRGFPCAKVSFFENGDPHLSRLFLYHGGIGVIGGDPEEDPKVLRSETAGCAVADAGCLQC
jgi:hypothetical protein